MFPLCALGYVVRNGVPMVWASNYKSVLICLNSKYMHTGYISGSFRILSCLSNWFVCAFRVPLVMAPMSF